MTNFFGDFFLQLNQLFVQKLYHPCVHETQGKELNDIYPSKQTEPISVSNNKSRDLSRCEACVILNPVTCGHYGCRVGPYAGLLFEGSEIIGKCNKAHHQITAQYLEGKHSHRSHNTALSCSRPNI